MFKKLLLILFTFILTSYGQTKDRISFLENFIKTTEERTAWSSPKWDFLKTSFVKDIKKYDLYNEFKYASSKSKMALALFKLNNLRKDSHLRFSGFNIFEHLKYAPIRFYPDFTNKSLPTFFVANVGKSIKSKKISRGDKLVAINGVDIKTYVDALAPYSNASTSQLMYFKDFGGFGKWPGLLAASSKIFGKKLASQSSVKYTIESSKTGRKRTHVLKVSTDRVEWMYPVILGGRRADNLGFYRELYKNLGFKLVHENIDAAFYINVAKRQAVLEWYDLENTEKSIESIIKSAEKNQALDFDLVIDATHGSGGSRCELVVKALADKPFKTTFGNVKTVDKDFVNLHKSSLSSRARSWVDKALSGNKEYTSNEPFKLRFFKEGSKGMMNPAEEGKRFTGKKVFLLFPWGI